MTEYGTVGNGAHDLRLDSEAFDRRVLRAAVRRLGYDWLWKSGVACAVVMASLAPTRGRIRWILGIPALGVIAVVVLHFMNLAWTYRELSHPVRAERLEILESLAATTKAAGDLDANAAALRCVARKRTCVERPDVPV